MSRFYVIFLIIMLSAYRLTCQNVADIIKKNAINCDSLSLPNDKLYLFLKNFKCICIGEMHGTKEPAEFLVYLTRLFTGKGHDVIIGFEIPKTQMSQFIEKPDSTNLSHTGFFSYGSTDGRSSEAWFNAINECRKFKPDFCFADNDSDSLIADNLLKCYKTDTNRVLIILTGNIHNKLVPYRNNQTMACYLKTHFSNKILSVNHIYNEGTMYNTTLEGTRTRYYPPTNNAFATATDYSRYFIPNIFNNTNGYSAYYYTKLVTASLPFKRTKKENKKQKNIKP